MKEGQISTLMSLNIFRCTTSLKLIVSLRTSPPVPLTESFFTPSAARCTAIA